MGRGLSTRLATCALLLAAALGGCGDGGGTQRQLTPADVCLSADAALGTFAENATEPFVNPFEMANADKTTVVAKIAAVPYAVDFTIQKGNA